MAPLTALLLWFAAQTSCLEETPLARYGTATSDDHPKDPLAADALSTRKWTIANLLFGSAFALGTVGIYFYVGVGIPFYASGALSLAFLLGSSVLYLIPHSTLPAPHLAGPGGSRLIFSEPGGFAIYLGDANDAQNFRALKAFGVGAVLNMVKQETPGDSFSKETYIRNLEKPNFLHLALETQDSLDFDIFPYFPQTSAFIEEARAAHLPLLVHCWLGLNRSGAAVAAWLVCHANLSVAEAVSLVRERRPGALANLSFVTQLEKLRTGNCPT